MSNKTGRYDVCVLGGGASGLAAAASLDKKLNTCLIEKNEILGRKILATGGGRCNITNAACQLKDLTLEFFKSLGLECREEDGRYYPYSNQAADVVRILEDEVRRRDVDVMLSFPARSVEREKDGFVVTGPGRTVHADRLLLATGGKAAPALGTTGDGYGFARALGHTVSRVYPILSGIRCGDFKDLRGVRARGRVSLWRGGVMLDEEDGEIQFNEDGLSGICVMNLTLLIRAKDGENLSDALKEYELHLDLAPDFTAEEIASRRDAFGILTTALARRLKPSEIKDWRLPVLGVKGWRDAQCSAGGVVMDEVDTATMGSKLVKNLFIAGELLDRQGKCGGFNLQNAWETGIIAARSINEQVGNG